MYEKISYDDFVTLSDNFHKFQLVDEDTDNDWIMALIFEMDNFEEYCEQLESQQ